MKTKLYVFDFDGTLMRSPEPEEGITMYERMFGTKYPHKGWWSKPESLHADYDIQPNQAVVEHYNLAKADPAAEMILMTNRLKRLQDLMVVHMTKHGLEFESMHFGDSVPGRQTKPMRLSNILGDMRASGHKITEVVVLDDMEEQIGHYMTMREDWLAWGSPMKLTILQVKDGAITER